MDSQSKFFFSAYTLRIKLKVLFLFFITIWCLQPSLKACWVWIKHYIALTTCFIVLFISFLFLVFFLFLSQKYVLSTTKNKIEEFLYILYIQTSELIHVFVIFIILANITINRWNSCMLKEHFRSYLKNLSIQLRTGAE